MRSSPFEPVPGDAAGRAGGRVLHLLAGGLALLLAVACSSLPGLGQAPLSPDDFDAGKPARASGGPPQIGEPAPAFRLQTPDGTGIELEQYRGRTVVLNFWATWCEPCKQEIPALQQVYQGDPARVAVLGVNEGDAPADIRQYLDGIGATFPVAVDSDLSVGSQYRVRGLPTTYFISPDGVVRQRAVGELKREQILERIRLTQDASAGHGAGPASFRQQAGAAAPLSQARRARQPYAGRRRRCFWRWASARPSLAVRTFQRW